MFAIIIVLYKCIKITIINKNKPKYKINITKLSAGHASSKIAK